MTSLYNTGYSYLSYAAQTAQTGANSAAEIVKAKADEAGVT